MYWPAGRLRALLSLLLVGLLTLGAAAKGRKDDPEITHTELDHQPVNILYFEDSDVVLYTDIHGRTAYRSADGGASWKPLDGVEEGSVFEVLRHPYDRSVAVVLGGELTHWITKDRGETWTEFTTKAPASRSRAGISFHATDPDRMLFMAEVCEDFWTCDEMVYYTLDGFKTNELLREDLANCLWAKTTELFTTGDKEADNNMVLCVALGKFSIFSTELRVVTSTDFFETEEEPRVDGATIQGVTNLAAVKHYFVFAAKSKGTTELAMYVTADGSTWHRAEFGEHKLEENAYTLLESTNYSMQVDVMTSKNAMGVLLTSNSNGTFFTTNIEHTNRNMPEGFVDFEKVSNIQGIVLVNVVDNWEKVEKSFMASKEIVSKISFDDGHTWEDMTASGKKLHLHSVTEQRNIGRIFSSPAPGIIMGIGNTGKHLKAFEEGDLFISDDAGLTWTHALDGPHIYEMGSQGSVLVAIEDSETDVVRWSLDHGKSWSKTKLNDKIRPLALTTTPDSTSAKFLLIAQKGKGAKSTFETIRLDFDGLHERECKSSDFELWPARVDSDGKPICVMGRIQKFKRRKADADCIVVNDDFNDPEEEIETCKCTEADFECDYNFKPVDGKCIISGALPVPEGACADNDSTFEGSSGYRLVPGNQCEGGVELDKPTKRPCKDSKTPVGSGKITSEITDFRGTRFEEYYYLERAPTASGSDETIVLRTKERDVYITHDHGKQWRKVLEDKDVTAIYPHQYIKDVVYFITPTKKVYYSSNRGLEKDYHAFETPDLPTTEQTPVLSFHPQQKEWLIWMGAHNCEKGGDCTTVAYVSQKGGDEWNKLLPAAQKCLFVYREDRPESDEKIICLQHENEDPAGPLELISSNDLFVHKQTLKKDVIDFASMSEYIVVAIRDEDKKSLKVDASIDGVTFADAKFPPNFKAEHQQAYTVLDSSTHAVFLHVTVNGNRDQEYGTILKSNSNGTSYVLSISQVNRNTNGYVDFEKVQGVEGVALVNYVSNAKEVDAGASKKLVTYITHNDGAQWAPLPRPRDPPRDVGEPFGCTNCNLHLHGFTERADPRDTFSSASAVGMMIAVGNVGDQLGRKAEGHTFLTRDAGLTWDMIATGNWMWEYGDQGSIIVIVKEDEPTSFVKYSLDEGKTWATYDFGSDMVVTDITTVPSDTSRNFLLWGKIGSKISTVNIDFSGLKEREKKCELVEGNAEKSDYTLWSPKHPLSDDDCLFGHVAQYHRKKIDRECYVGQQPEILHDILRNCTCTREDFECDYNYELGNNGECRLVPGLEKPDPSEVCRTNPSLTEYYGVTGYRRIPLSTCKGGQELDFTNKVFPCPNHEDEFNRKHSISGAGLFFAIVLPIAAAVGVGYWVYRNWDGKFGRIRLGDGMGSSGAFDRDAPWIKYPVVALSAVVAVIAALPLLAASLWRIVSKRLGRNRSGYTRPYTSRSSFQRGTYSVMDPDDAELLGDSDEEP